MHSFPPFPSLHQHKTLQFFQRNLVIVLVTLSVCVSAWLYIQRMKVPGEVQYGVYTGRVLGSNREISVSIPFSFAEYSIDSQDTVELQVPIQDLSLLHQPAFFFARPLHYLEVEYRGRLLNAPITSRIGIDAVLLPFPHDFQHGESFTIRIQGDYGSGGLDDVFVVGEYTALSRYLLLKSVTSVFLISVLFFIAFSMSLLVLFRPKQTNVLSIAIFSLVLALVGLTNAEVWYVFSSSVEYQIRVKTLSVACSLAWSFHILGYLSRRLIGYTNTIMIVFVLFALSALIMPDLFLVLQIRVWLTLFAIPFIVLTGYYFLTSYKDSTRETKMYYSLSVILLITGIIDILGVYDWHTLPPTTPIGAALFMIGVSVYLVMQSGDLARRYRGLVEKSLDAVCIINSAFDIVESNPCAQSLNLRQNTNFLHVLDKSVQQTFIEFQGAYNINNLSATMELRFENSGQIFESHVVELEEKNFMLVLRDITQRKQMERKLLESVKLETVERVSSGIAHDFNNLFTAIGGQIYLLAQENGTQAEQRVDKLMMLLQNGSHSVRRLLSLIQGKQQERQKIVLDDWFTKILPLFQSLLPEDTQIDMQFCPEQISVQISPEELEQVLVNIIFNARDAIATSNNLRRVWIEISLQSETEVCIAVEDSGIGIEKSIRDTIFNPFVTTKAAHKGTGIGLTIVRNIVTNSKGRIVVAEPQYGAGARFEVCFPCVSQIVEKKASHQGPYTILVLEDDPLILDVIEAFLSIANYCVLPCSNIEQAKRELQEHDVHCIVSDVILGDRAQDNGILFCKELKNTGFPNPICIISGFIPDTDASIPSSWYFLAKPFQRLSFLEMVQTIIRDNVIVEHTKEVMLSTK